MLWFFYLFFYSWGRWTDILLHGRYKRQLTEQDVETICRTILVYCLNHYKGDENIKSFIWDLITPTADGQTRALVNHSGMCFHITSSCQTLLCETLLCDLFRLGN